MTSSPNNIIKFADDTTVIGLISEGDETAYREEVQFLTVWCFQANNLLVKTTKTKEAIIDSRMNRENDAPLHINTDQVERVTSFRFLGVHISEDLS